jgi:hypothetical protein
VRSGTQLTHNRPSKSRAYARYLVFGCARTGNRGELKYGRRLPWADIAPYRMEIESSAAPISYATVGATLADLFCGSPRVEPRYAELTFDIRGISVAFLWRHVVSRAQVRDVFGCPEKRTFYIGSPHSSWQVRCYDKAESVVRLEFVLRAGFFRQHQVHRLEHIAKLTRAALFSELIGLREFRSGYPGCSHVFAGNSLQQRAAFSMSRAAPIRDVSHLLQTEHGLTPSSVLKICPEQRLLERMQRRLVW